MLPYCLRRQYSAQASDLRVAAELFLAVDAWSHHHFWPVINSPFSLFNLLLSFLVSPSGPAEDEAYHIHLQPAPTRPEQYASGASFCICASPGRTTRSHHRPSPDPGVCLSRPSNPDAMESTSVAVWRCRCCVKPPDCRMYQLLLTDVPGLKKLRRIPLN
jgi:hypothetical protein